MLACFAPVTVDSPERFATASFVFAESMQPAIGDSRVLC